jgi:hypothetical protein
MRGDLLELGIALAEKAHRGTAVNPARRVVALGWSAGGWKELLLVVYWDWVF